MTLRTQIEKIIWKHYKPMKHKNVEMALNVEEMLDELMPVVEVVQATEHTLDQYKETFKELAEGDKVDNSLTKENRTLDDKLQNNYSTTGTGAIFPHPLEEGWTKEFERLGGEKVNNETFLPEGHLFYDNEYPDNKNALDPEKVKQFFSQTLAQERNVGWWEGFGRGKEETLDMVRESVEKMDGGLLKGTPVLSKTVVLSFLTDLSEEKK